MSPQRPFLHPPTPRADLMFKSFAQLCVCCMLWSVAKWANNIWSNTKTNRMLFAYHCLMLCWLRWLNNQTFMRWNVGSEAWTSDLEVVDFDPHPKSSVEFVSWHYTGGNLVFHLPLSHPKFSTGCINHSAVRATCGMCATFCCLCYLVLITALFLRDSKELLWYQKWKDPKSCIGQWPRSNQWIT